MADKIRRPDIAVDKICRIVVKVRQFAVKEDVVQEDYGANPVDEAFRLVLEAYADDPVFQEVRTFINDLDIDEQCEVVALAWVGRGDYSADEWEAAVAMARQEHNDRTAEYLLGMPHLADHLEDGLSQFDLSCQDFELGRL